MWALAWDTQTRRLERWGQDRQERWERRRSGEAVEDGKPKPAREFARVWWHTGPSQRWADGWQRAADKRRTKLQAANEPPDRQVNDSPVAAPVPAADVVAAVEEPVVRTGPADERKEPLQAVQPERAGEDTTAGSDDEVNEERKSEMSTSFGGPSLASGEAPNLDAKQAFVQSYATVFPAIKGAFLSFANTLAADEYGTGFAGGCSPRGRGGVGGRSRGSRPRRGCLRRCGRYP